MASVSPHQDENRNYMKKDDDELSPISKRIEQQQKLSLVPLKEDILIWISSLTGNN